eukprot:TRINITY_DN15136_c0_g1_i1.p1 TRINITY_DN15136_c0_g1~~TRINITY_DN15136_c0_g1_i1.p1  ORF type:complete len:532 (-),score=102.84 TRINITY_DN15136_c0_g1_i1:26-1621(-)
MLTLIVLLFVSLASSTDSGYKRYHISTHSTTYTPRSWELTPRSLPHPNIPTDVKPDDYFRFIPHYVGTVLPGQSLSWSSSCFANNNATLSVTSDSISLAVSTLDKQSFFCSSGYLFAYFSSFDIVYFELPDTHGISWSASGLSNAELFDVNTLGVRVFNFSDGVLFSGEELFETVMLFFGGLIGAHVPEWTADDNLQFLADHMNVVMPVRPIQRVNISKSEFKSGDFLGVIRLDGLDPMLAWGMGSHTGHTCITMWIDNELYVCESTTNSAYWPTNGIQKTPFDKWIDQAQAANYNVVHLPLDPEIAKTFNVQKAWDFFNTVEGLPYGFHNLFTGWIDTEEDNYPPPLTSHLVQLLAPFAQWLLFKEMELGQTYDFLTQGLNFRLGNKEMQDLATVYMQAYKQGLPFTKLMTLPEEDSWVYQNTAGTRAGPSMVCDVLVMSMWKAGGIFGNLTDLIEATEFTNWDAYTLNIFDANYKRPAACVEADPDSQFCQLLGKYRMALPGYNTFTPFPHMRQTCPSLPPNYIKPTNC